LGSVDLTWLVAVHARVPSDGAEQMKSQEETGN
jgi:hypothetical protein